MPQPNDEPVKTDINFFVMLSRLIIFIEVHYHSYCSCHFVFRNLTDQIISVSVDSLFTLE